MYTDAQHKPDATADTPFPILTGHQLRQLQAWLHKMAPHRVTIDTEENLRRFYRAEFADQILKAAEVPSDVHVAGE